MLPENWQAIEVFVACQTQWRYLSGMGGAVRTGLDYTAVHAVMVMMQVEDTKDCLMRLQVCEQEALEIFNERDAAL